MDRLVRINPTGFKIEGRHEDAYFTGWFVKWNNVVWGPHDVYLDAVKTFDDLKNNKPVRVESVLEIYERNSDNDEGILTDKDGKECYIHMFVGEDTYVHVLRHLNRFDLSPGSIIEAKNKFWRIKEVEENLYDTSYLTKIVVDEVVIS